MLVIPRKHISYYYFEYIVEVAYASYTNTTYAKIRAINNGKNTMKLFYRILKLLMHLKSH